jgi:hypothetical protein
VSNWTLPKLCFPPRIAFVENIFIVPVDLENFGDLLALYFGEFFDDFLAESMPTFILKLLNFQSFAILVQIWPLAQCTFPERPFFVPIQKGNQFPCHQMSHTAVWPHNFLCPFALSSSQTCSLEIIAKLHENINYRKKNEYLEKDVSSPPLIKFSHKNWYILLLPW